MRRTLILAGLVALVASVAAAWWWWRPASPHPRSAATPESAATTEGTPGPELALEVNDASTLDVAAGPVFFSLTLIQTDRESSAGLEQDPRAWSSRLRFETLEGKPLPFSIERLGDPVTYPLAREVRGEAGGTAARERLPSAAAMYRLQFGVSPEEADRIPPGTYVLRAVLPVVDGSATGPGIVSNAVSFKMGPAPQAGERESPRRLAQAARFHLRAGKWDEAHRLALELVRREDAGIEAFILLGDALNGLRRDEESLAAYQEALARVPEGASEPPRYVIARMNEVQERLEKSAQKPPQP